MTEVLVKLAVAFLPGIVAGVAAWLVVRGIATGEFPLRSRIYNRRIHPIPFWFGMAIAVFAVYIFGTATIRILAG
jgi:hypothetical protein